MTSFFFLFNKSVFCRIILEEKTMSLNYQTFSLSPPPPASEYLFPQYVLASFRLFYGIMNGWMDEWRIRSHIFVTLVVSNFIKSICYSMAMTERHHKCIMYYYYYYLYMLLWWWWLVVIYPLFLLGCNEIRLRFGFPLIS